MMNEQELWLTWQAYQARLAWLDRLRGADSGETEEEAQLALALLPKVTALQALAAGRQLAESIRRRRWYVMQAAKEAGVTWAELGVVLGTTAYEAQEWYGNQQRLGEV